MNIFNNRIDRQRLGAKPLLLVLMVTLAATAVLALDLASTRAQSCATVSLGTISESGSVVREGRLAIGDCASNISFRLADVYVFRLTRTAAVRIGMEQTGSTWGDPELFLLNADGSEIARNDDGGPGSSALIGWRLDAGTYRVEAATHRPGGIFTYSLSIAVAYTHTPNSGDGEDSGGNGGDPGDSETVSGTAQGRIIARIVDWNPGSRNVNCDYRIEFGFLPEWAVSPDRNPTSALINANAVLPRNRYLTCAQILSREERSDQRWLPSSIIEVPVSEPSSTSGFIAGDDDSTFTGYVIVRYVLWRGASLRIEFGFLPSWAYTGDADLLQGAAEQHAVLPARRYISRATIANEGTDWLFSPVIDVPASGGRTVVSLSSPTVVLKQGQNVGTRRVGQVIGSVASSEFGIVRASDLPPLLSIELGDAVTNRDGRETRPLVLTGTVERTTADRSYNVTIFIRIPSGQNVTGNLTIDIEEELNVPRVDWIGYRESFLVMDGQADPVTPTVIEGPTNPVWRYHSATEEVCEVNTVTGQVISEAPGECEIVATLQAKDGWGQAVAITQLQVVALPPPVSIVWEGYEPSRMEIGGESPRLLRPHATDSQTGRSVSLDYAYERDDASADVCTVSRNTGRIAAYEEGVCTVRAVSVPTDAYVSASSNWIRVAVGSEVKGPRSICILDYPTSVLINDQASASLQCSPGTPIFESETPRTCSVNSGSGDVTGIAVGICTIKVTVVETARYLQETDVHNLLVRHNPSPVCRMIGVIVVESGRSSQPIDLNDYCESPEGGSLRYEILEPPHNAIASISNGSQLVIHAATVGEDTTTNITFSAGNADGQMALNIISVKIMVDGSAIEGGDAPPPPDRGFDADDDEERMDDSSSDPPPIPSKGYALAYCGSDDISLYYFEYTAFDHRQWTKHHLAMRWESAVAIWRKYGMTLSDRIIGEDLSQSQCDEWPTGSPYTMYTLFEPRRG